MTHAVSTATPHRGTDETDEVPGGTVNRLPARTLHPSQVKGSFENTRHSENLLQKFC
jgi:hypothetical protein